MSNPSASMDRAAGDRVCEAVTIERVDDCLVIRIACYGAYEGVTADQAKSLAAAMIDAAIGGRAPQAGGAR